MTLYKGICEYTNFLKRYWSIIFSVYFILELIIFLSIGKTSIFVFTASLFITLFVLCTITLMFKDIDTSFLMYIISIPLLPITSYLFYRLNIKWAGNSIYIVYSIILIYCVLINKNKFEKISIKGAYKLTIVLYVYFIASAIISICTAKYKLEASYIVLIGMVNMIMFSLVILSYKRHDFNFIKKILLYLCIGIVISSIPDTTIALYSIIFQGSNTHLYGVLGSNYMLGYTTIVLPLILINAIDKSVSREYHNIYKVLLAIEIVGLCTQRSRGIFIVLLIVFIGTIINNKKYFIKYSIIGLIVLTCIGNNIMMRGELSDIKETIENNGIAAVLDKKDGILAKLVEQTQNRRPIWAIAFRMIDDNKSFGVGPGHFKYYYTTYGGNPENVYSDAHNIFLNIATEYGLIFTFVFFISWLINIALSILLSIRNKLIYFRAYIVPIFIGMFSLIIYGNITGQAFMTSVYPISISPLFTYTLIMSILILLRKAETLNINN